MNATQAYDLACELFGSDAGVLEIPTQQENTRKLVGRWVPIQEARGVSNLLNDRRDYVLPTGKSAFLVLGEASTWETAIETARFHPQATPKKKASP